MTISLAFLAPNLVKAAINGRLPHGIGVTRLTDLAAEWSRQHQMLGLSNAEPPIEPSLRKRGHSFAGNDFPEPETSGEVCPPCSSTE